nr:immunoglobulin heavy chain junction region [Macaca mulatta]MOV58180.1 immunoglobulin heavy chain junction region [Macaca mulatta]
CARDDTVGTVDVHFGYHFEYW